MCTPGCVNKKLYRRSVWITRKWMWSKNKQIPGYTSWCTSRIVYFIETGIICIDANYIIFITSWLIGYDVICFSKMPWLFVSIITVVNTWMCVKECVLTKKKQKKTSSASENLNLQIIRCYKSVVYIRSILGSYVYGSFLL